MAEKFKPKNRLKFDRFWYLLARSGRVGGAGDPAKRQFLGKFRTKCKIYFQNLAQILSQILDQLCAILAQICPKPGPESGPVLGCFDQPLVARSAGPTKTAFAAAFSRPLGAPEALGHENARQI